MYAVINTSFMNLDEVLGGFNNVPFHVDFFFFLVVSPFEAVIFLPQIACTISISWTVTVKSRIFGFEQST